MRSAAHIAAGLVLAAVLHLVPHVAAADIYKLDLNSELGKRLSNLPENGWVQLNVNQFQDVWTPLDQRPKPPEAPSVGGPWSIIEAWSSMAWDGNRGNLIFYGGGHANYPGNDVYRWIASTMQWERASLPSEVYLATGTVLFYAKDGPFNAPAAAHTYDSTEFLPLADRYITFGGASFNTGHYYDLIDGTRTGPYVWDPSRAYPNAVGGTAGSQVKPTVYTSVIGGQMWQNRNNLEPPSASEPRPGYSGTFMINGTSAYTQENGRDVLYLQDSAELFKYTLVDVNDPTKDTYQRVGRYIFYPFSGQGAGAYDPYRKIFLRTADSTITYWSLVTPGDNNQNVIVNPVVTSGTFPFSSLKQYGLDFDPIRRVFVLWAGLNDVWALRAPADLATGTWTLEPLSPSSATAPNLNVAHTGILGKWKYAASLDVFLGAFDPYQGQIWAYKPVNWQPSVVSPIPFLVTPRAGSSVAAGSDIAVKASSVDTTVSNISVWANGSLIGTGSSVPFSFTWRSVPAGSYSLTVRATGSDGVQRTSAPIAISVTGTGNTPPQVALTAPAQGAIYSSGSNIFPTATASDPDAGGSVARVEFWADGGKLGEDTTAPYAFTWVAPAVGTHVLTAVAYDNLGASATSTSVTVTVTGTATNTPPTVALTAPAAGASYTVGANIAMSATASDADVGGSIARVEFWSNGAKLGEDTTSPYAFTWIAPPVGSYSLTAKAFDNVGASTVSAPPVSVTVNDVVSGGQTVTLQDGVNGYSGGRDTYLYEYHNTTNFGAQTYLQDKNTVSRFRSLVRFAIFQAEGGPVPNGATIISAKLSLYKYSAYDTVFRLRPLLVNWVEGEATWQIRSAGVAWNAAGATGAGTDLSASYDAETAAVWNPGWVDFDVTTGVGAISAGRTNNGWLLDAVSGNSNIKQFYSGEYAIDATLRPKLVISYTSGGAGNTPPTVTLTAPAANTTFAAGASIGLAANASDPDVGGSVARVEFWADGGKLGEDVSAPYAFTWNSPASGTHVLTAVAVDNLGASTTSSSVTVTVSAPNSPPTVALTAPAANSTFVFGNSIGLTATASDPDVGGSVVRVEFWANGSKLGEDLTAPYAFTWSAPPVGTQVLTAVAVDNLGAATTSASVTVTVTSATGSATVTLQDGVGGYSGTRDTYLYEFHAGINFGSKTFLEDKATTSRFRSMVRFAVFTSEGGPVPDGATIVSATLSLYKFSSYDYIYRLRPLLTNWVETQATWQISRTGVPWGAAGATGVGTDLATTYDAQASAVWNPGWVAFDVTNGIKAMATGRTNYGWLLEPVSGNSNLKEFQSREYTKDPTLRPKLVITYQN